jgi:hypothetical protein
MPSFETELRRLKQQIVEIEKAKEKKIIEVMNPVRALEDLLDQKKERMDRLYYPRQVPYIKHVDAEILDVLEPLVNALNLLQIRLKKLEDKLD